MGRIKAALPMVCDICVVPAGVHRYPPQAGREWLCWTLLNECRGQQESLWVFRTH